MHKITAGPNIDEADPILIRSNRKPRTAQRMPSSPSPRSSPAPPSPPSKNATTTASAGWFRPSLTQPNVRRPSVQFVPQVKTDTANPSRSSSAQPTGTRKASVALAGPPTGSNRRLSSPPPTAPFRPSVSFDTFSNKEASDFSLTLNRKHRDYVYTKRSRTFLCGTDTNDYSDTALEWLIDEIVEDGDEVVCLRVVEKDSREAAKWAERGYRKEAERFLEAIEKKNTEGKTISLVLEFSIGKVNDTIQQMIRIYEPAMLIVGTRGRPLTGYQGLLTSGSVSKYCLQYSPIPVVVVRPSSKREAKKKKRLRDPDRTGYRDILDKSEDAPRGRGGHLLDKTNRMSVVGSHLGALGELGSAGDADHEARMVAEAIGYRDRGERMSTAGARSNSLQRVTSTRSDASDGSQLQSVLKSPDLDGHADISDDEDDDDDLDDEDIGPLAEEAVRPEDAAAMVAYQRAQQVFEEEREEERARAERSASRGNRGGSRSRSRRGDGAEEGRGSEALGLLAQLDRGMK